MPTDSSPAAHQRTAYTIPGIAQCDADDLAALLQDRRSWDDYSLGRATALEHLAALDLVYAGVIESHRKAIEASEEPDPVSQDMLTDPAQGQPS